MITTNGVVEGGVSKFISYGIKEVKIISIESKDDGSSTPFIAFNFQELNLYQLYFRG